MLLSATFPLNVRIILSDPFSDGSSFYVDCFCNHCRRKNHNCLTINLMRHASCVYNKKTSPIDLIPVRTKTLYPTPLPRPTDYPTRPTDSLNRKGKLHVPADPELDPLSSDSSLNEYNSSDDTNYSKSNKKERNMKRKRRKHKR